LAILKKIKKLFFSANAIHRYAQETTKQNIGMDNRERIGVVKLTP
jgi:hypothetical protein